ncbi:hypothetical protein [Paracoccus aestuariivivens]|uniref:hypothetical protein n=1 Tax=Paracoccus aestuariivivens TaxID=1820333 RepID=UPI001B8AEE21|nr:hypothetical protein [Paracoccus aestuariivivens]
MKDDLNASEKRLIAALDRIDSFIDRTAELRMAVPTILPDSASQSASPAELLESQALNQRLSDELAALRASHSSTVAGFEARLKVMNERLAEAEDRAVDLVAANEALSAANRGLFDTDPATLSGATYRALEAEIESLRSARNAERGKLGEIVDTLDRLLGVTGSDAPDLAPPPEPVRPAVVETPMPLDTGMTAESEPAEMSDATDEQRG